MKAMCKFFGVSRAAYYAWERKLGETDPDQGRMEKIQAVYEVSHKSYGYRRITALLHQEGWQVNHKHVARIRRQEGLSAAETTQTGQALVGRWLLYPPTG